MSKVFVIDTTHRPLNPVHPGEARRLLTQGKAAVWRRFPFILILKDAVSVPHLDPLRLKLDPGSRTTGIAVVNDATGEVVFAAELTHRGQAIKKSLDTLRAIRRARRARKTRYRKPRFVNRRKPKGWLAPSLLSRVHNVETWVRRLRALCPITALSMELVCFDMQALETPEIEGAAYQQGTRAGYEIREYVLAKWERRCAYCGAREVPLQVEHIHPRAKGGTDRISNLTLACEPCNRAKGTQDIRVFLSKKPEVLRQIQAASKAPLKDAAAVNSTRWALFERLKETGLPVECGSGGLTKYNRTKRDLPKTHWLDAANVGASTPETLQVKGVVPLRITACGSGNRQLCGTNADGFPIRHRKRQKVHHGYQTGDIVRAIVPASLKTGGTHTGRVLVRTSGSFDIQTTYGRRAGISFRYCHPIHRKDGYQYEKGVRHSSPA